MRKQKDGGREMKPHKNATFSLPQSRFARQLPRQREPKLSYCNHPYKPRFVRLKANRLGISFFLLLPSLFFYFLTLFLSSSTAREIKSSTLIVPRSPFSPRSLTERVRFSTSLSPIISIYGTFWSLASRIL